MNTQKHPPTPQVEDLKKQDKSSFIEMREIQDFVSPAPLTSQTLPEPSFVVSPQKQHNHPLSNADEQLLPQLTPEKEQALIRYNHISYMLYLLSFFTLGLTWIFPVFMNYYKRREADGTWLATHFDWQLKTFWYQFLILVCAWFVAFFGAGSGVGWIVGLISGGDYATLGFGAITLLMLSIMLVVCSFIWHLYRIVRGWRDLSNGRPV